MISGVSRVDMQVVYQSLNLLKNALGHQRWGRNLSELKFSPLCQRSVDFFEAAARAREGRLPTENDVIVLKREMTSWDIENFDDVLPGKVAAWQSLNNLITGLDPLMQLMFQYNFSSRATLSLEPALNNESIRFGCGEYTHSQFPFEFVLYPKDPAEAILKTVCYGPAVGLTFSRTSAYFCNFPVVFARPLSVLLDLIGRAPFAVVINEIPTACFGLPLVQFLYFWSDSKTRVNELKSFMHSSTDQAFARWNSLLINNGLSERADFLFPFGGE